MLARQETNWTHVQALLQQQTANLRRLSACYSGSNREGAACSRIRWLSEQLQSAFGAAYEAELRGDRRKVWQLQESDKIVGFAIQMQDDILALWHAEFRRHPHLDRLSHESFRIIVGKFPHLKQLRTLAEGEVRLYRYLGLTGFRDFAWPN